MTKTPPIEVRASAAPSMLLSAVRLAAVFSFGMLVRHLMADDPIAATIIANSEVVGAVAAALATGAWALLDRWRTHNLLKALADALPNWSAQVKR